jgi:hypothetical protein
MKLMKEPTEGYETGVEALKTSPSPQRENLNPAQTVEIK